MKMEGTCTHTRAITYQKDGVQRVMYAFGCADWDSAPQEFLSNEPVPCRARDEIVVDFSLRLDRATGGQRVNVEGVHVTKQAPIPDAKDAAAPAPAARPAFTNGNASAQTLAAVAR